MNDNTLHGVSGTPLDMSTFNALTNPIQAPQFSTKDILSTATSHATGQMTYMEFLNSGLAVTELQHLIRSIPRLDTSILQSILTGQASNLAKLAALATTAVNDYNTHINGIVSSNNAIRNQTTSQLTDIIDDITDINGDTLYSAQLGLVNAMIPQLTQAQKDAIIATGVTLPLPSAPALTTISTSFSVNADTASSSGVAAFNSSVTATKNTIAANNTTITLINKYRAAFTQIVTLTNHTSGIAALNPQSFDSLDTITTSAMSSPPSFADSSAGQAFVAASTLLTSSTNQGFSISTLLTQQGQGIDILTLLTKALQSSNAALNVAIPTPGGGTGNITGTGGALIATAGESSAVVPALASSVIASIIAEFVSNSSALLQAQFALLIEGISSKTAVLGIHGAASVIASANGATPSSGAIALAAAIGNLQATGVLIASNVIQDEITLLINSSPELAGLTEKEKTDLIAKLVAATILTLILNAISVLGQELDLDGQTALEDLVQDALVAQEEIQGDATAQDVASASATTTGATTLPAGASVTTAGSSDLSTRTRIEPDRDEEGVQTTSTTTFAPTSSNVNTQTALANLSAAIQRTLSPTDPAALAHAITSQISFTLTGLTPAVTTAEAGEAVPATSFIPFVATNPAIQSDFPPAVGVESQAFTNPAFPTPTHYTINTATSSAAPTSDTAAVTAENVPTGTTIKDKPTYSYPPLMQQLLASSQVFYSSSSVADRRVVEQSTNDFHSHWENPTVVLKNRLDPGKAFWSMVFPQGDNQQPFSRMV